MFPKFILRRVDGNFMYPYTYHGVYAHFKNILYCRLLYGLSNVDWMINYDQKSHLL